MIRMKAKGVLLSIMLLVASCVFFACKEPAEIKVESISFTEQSISLLVDEEYTPVIKVLPSYATLRSYKLISNDVTALKIDGGTITALKPAIDVKLKVVSDENENINDVISVNIYSEATELEAPTELRFDGERFTFVGKDNANAYMLSVNGKEINIGNNTEYDFTDVFGKVNNLYNQVVTCKVKAIGDGKVFKDSEYSQQVLFVKLASVANAYVEDEVLYFDAIKNVGSYSVTVSSNYQNVKSSIVQNLNFDKAQLSLDMSELTDSVNGAQYTIQIRPNVDGYNSTEDIDVFGGEVFSLNYATVGQVKNLSMVEKTLSWGFVQNAQSYTVQVYKGAELVEEISNITNNYLTLAYEDAGDYYCKVIANSTMSNTTTGKEYSLPLYFEILSAPQIDLTNNTVSWTALAGAEGYLVTIKDFSGDFVANQKFVLYNTYDVSKFSAGTYTIEVVACGNGENGKDVKAILSSKKSVQASWTILNGLQNELQIKSQKLYWKDLDENSLNKYRLKFDNIDVTLTPQDYNSQYYYDQTTNSYVYDLASHNFEPGEHTISIQNMGENSVFDAVEDKLKIVKLQQSAITNLANKKFEIASVDNASEYKVEIYKAGDLTAPVLDLESNNVNDFVLDASKLSAGEYEAKVFVYGNGVDIFDADVPADNTTLHFKKLATPAVNIDKPNFKVVVGLVDNAEGYRLFENGNNLSDAFVDNQYSLQALTAGEYCYTAQAVGNGATILDSEITIAENSKNVKKLPKPTIDFTKEELKFEVSCGTDDELVDYYTFTLNDKPIAVANNVVHCSREEDINLAGNYDVKVWASPRESADYNLVIASDTQVYALSKLDGLCDFAISNGMLIVTPDVLLTGSGYNLTLRIDNGENDIVLNEFNYLSSQFAIRLQDMEYNAIEAISTIMEGAGEYDVYTAISQNVENVVASNEVKSVNKETSQANTIKVLDKVTGIAKDEQTIVFDSVANAENYIAIIEVDSNEYYIDIAQSESVLTMEKLLTLMDDIHVPYLEQTPYTISFVAKSNDIHTIANKGVDKYTFEFLKTPNVRVIENADNSKHLEIVNTDANASSYYVKINQNESIVTECLETKSEADTTIVDIDKITKDATTGLPKLVAGAIKFFVKSSAISGNYFNSKNSELNVVKLDSSAIAISEGLLNWGEIANAKQYNLVYSNLEGTKTIVLTDGSENFTIQDGRCVYNFDNLMSGNTSMYLQVDSNLEQDGVYYLNSNNGDTFDAYKMVTPTINVVNGKVYIEMLMIDLTLSQKIDLKVDGQDGIEVMLDGENIKVMSKGIDLVELNNESVELNILGDKLGVTIDPSVLCKYGETELLKETISIKAYSNDSKTLNSSTNTAEVYGLLSPLNLDITTSIHETDNNAIDEVLEKITWRNPQANETHVAKYRISINYKDVEYIFNSTSNAFIMPKYCDYDANNNGELDYDEDINGNDVLDDGEDINGNGKRDNVEIVFGAGVYTIKVRALTDNSEKYVNSNYCAEIVVTILDTPNTLAVQDGNIIWSTDISVGYYIVKIYLFGTDEGGNSTKTLIMSSQSNVSELDLTKLNPLTTGVYGISVQAMHDASRILASKESEILQVIRLPQATQYYIKDGELYIRLHKFFSKAEVYLTDKATGEITHKLPVLENLKASENISNYILSNAYAMWNKSDIITTYQDDKYFEDFKYEFESDSTLRQVLAEDYHISVKLFGNVFASTDLSKLNIGGIVSGHISHPVNRYLKNINASDTNIIEKLITPTTTVSETERGVVLASIQNGLNYNLKYYIDGKKSLQGVHLYEVNITTGDTYTLYVAEIVDNDKFTASLKAVDRELIQDGEGRQYLKHFEYNGITFNVIDKDANGNIAFNFNTANYYYYEPINNETKQAGGYCYIDLSKGGSFVVNVRFMGDDTVYANSNVTESVTIRRYSPLNLMVKNGEISWLNQATVDDHPIYLITLVGDAENYNLVLYNPNAEYAFDKTEEEVAQYLLQCLDNSKTYIFDTITYVVDEQTKDEVITYKRLADVIDMARVVSGGNSGRGGVFDATIRAHYTDVSSNDIILAQEAKSRNMTILPQSAINVANGALTWDMSSIINTGGVEYITNYSLQVFDGANKLYEMTLESGMYNTSFDSRNQKMVATYQLPQLINNGSDGDFVFTSGANYTFNLVALGVDGGAYINSIATTTGEINLLPQLENVIMEDGVLTWTNNTANSVEIYISYKVGDTITTYTTITSANSFELPIAFSDISGSTKYFIAGNQYYIRARLKGGTKTLNGFYNDEFGGQIVDEYKVVTERLVTVPSASIVTNSGVLTWEGNNLEGVTYTIEYTLADGTVHTTDMLDNNSFNFAGVVSGIIKVKVFAHHDKYFTSFASNTNERGEEVEDKIVEVYKLNAVSGKSIKYHEGSTIISWDKVKDADGNYIENYKVSIMQDGAETQEYNCYNSDTTDSNQWIITGVVGSSFSIAVKAISVDSAGSTVNSDYTEYCLMALPNQVTVFRFDEDEQAFMWKAIDGEQESDSYYIGYNYYITRPMGNNAPNQIAEFEVTQYKEINGEKYYYYYPSVMGSYRLIYIQVKRAGSLSSQPTRCQNQDGSDFDLDFYLFEAGDGSTDSPYRITNESHLRNIKYFLGANYVLDKSFALNSTEPITTATQIFTGTINGNGNTITGVANVSYGALNEYVGLFANVQGATFTNIILTNFSINGYVSAKNSYIGILVGRAEQKTLLDGNTVQSKFQDITITASTIKITKSNSVGFTNNIANIYVGAIAGYAQNSSFTNCVVSLGGTVANIIADLEGNEDTKLSLGGVVGYVKNSQLTNNTSNGDITSGKAYVFTASLTNPDGGPSPTIYAGALVGEVVKDGTTVDATNLCSADRILGSSTREIDLIGNKI